MKRKRSWHVHSGDEKRLAVALTGGPQVKKIGRPRTDSHPTLDPVPGPEAVSEASLRRYRHEIREQGDVQEPMPRGHPPPRLSASERRVVGGKVLWRFAKGKVNSGDSIAAWIHKTFNKTVSQSYVVALMQELHLTPHRFTEKPLKYWNANIVPELWELLKSVHARLDQGLRPNQLVVLDYCYWTSNDIVVRTYGPQGRYENLRPCSLVPRPPLGPIFWLPPR